MFFSNSRYFNLSTYQVTKTDGTVVTVTTLPQPSQNPLLGFFQRQNNQRLDLIASYFLADATTFWQLCDVNNAVAPDALAVHSQVGIPKKG